MSKLSVQKQGFYKDEFVPDREGGRHVSEKKSFQIKRFFEFSTVFLGYLFY